MFRRTASPRPARRSRALQPCGESLEGRSLMSVFQASFNPGGGIYNVDSLTGLGHHKDGDLLSTHLDGIGIADFSVGKTSAGQDDAFVQAVGTKEIYKYTATTGFVDQHLTAGTVQALPNGGAYAIAPNGSLLAYTEQGGWVNKGGSGIKNISTGFTPQGTPQVFLTTTTNQVYIYSDKTGGVDQHGQLTSIDALPNGDAYGLNAQGAVFHYKYGKGWSSLGVTGINSLTVGHDSRGTEDVYLHASNNEIYLYTATTGVIDLRGQLKSVAATNNGTMYGIGLDGELFVFNVGVGFKGLGGSQIDRVAVGTDANGADEVYVHTNVITLPILSISTIREYRPSTGFTLIIDALSM